MKVRRRQRNRKIVRSWTIFNTEVKQRSYLIPLSYIIDGCGVLEMKNAYLLKRYNSSETIWDNVLQIMLNKKDMKIKPTRVIHGKWRMEFPRFRWCVWDVQRRGRWSNVLANVLTRFNRLTLCVTLRKSAADVMVSQLGNSSVCKTTKKEAQTATLPEPHTW